MHLLSFQIREPLPGGIPPELAAGIDAEEAVIRYRAIILTTLRQLRGLVETRIRLHVTPSDAEEAVRFWLLPKLADRWQADGLIFRSEGWEIDLGEAPGKFTSHCVGEILCPNLGSRWVHAALAGLGRSVSRVIGPEAAGEYFRAEPAILQEGLPPRFLPPLPVIRTDADWRKALDSALGPKLKRAWEEESGFPFPD